MYTRPHLTDTELNKWLKKIKTKKAVLIIDCCYAGGIAKKGARVRGSGNIPIPKENDSIVLTRRRRRLLSEQGCYWFV